MSSADTSRPPTISRNRSSNSVYRRSSPPMKKSNLEDSIRKYKVLEALRSNDIPYLSRLIAPETDASSVSSQQTSIDLSTILHLAVQVASPTTVEFIISSNNPAVDINGVDSDGNTPLHLAAALGREDVVQLLLDQPGINDTVPNSGGRQPFEVCRYPELSQAMQISRAQFVQKAATELKRCFDANSIPGIESVLANPRAAALLDINGQDPTNGSTVLHQAARAKDIKMVQFILNHGGDPFRRDRKGKLPIDVCKDDNIRKILKAATKKQSIMTGQPANEAPHMKGYLKKWTNYTSGYKLRWFVLENGVLSYYKHQDDAGAACRGSINMRIANLRLDSSEKQRFEIIGKGSVRYHLRANHPVEANRWVWALSQAIQHAKDEAKSQRASKPMQLAGDAQSFTTTIMSIDETGSTRHSVNAPVSAVQHALPGAAGSYSPSVPSSSIDEEDFDDYDDESQDHQDAEEPYRDEVSMTAHSLSMEIKVLQDISASVADERNAIKTSHPKIEAVLACYDASLKSLKNLLNELLRQTQAREAYFRQLAENEGDLRRIWEENMQKLAEENDQIEEHLHDAVEEKKRAKKALRQVLQQEVAPTAGTVSPSAAGFDDVLNEEEDDVFFDAIDNEAASAVSVEARSIEKKMDEKTGLSDLYTEIQRQKMNAIVADGSFHGYDDPPRTRLRLDEDDRPKISLWGILKNLIGKDMTKMTLPVSFNECTSLLQRVAEDMEYVDLLDEAASKDDSALRMVYVAAFAASEYSSTINRIAKPFNPLLGETYEYCRPDRGYRFFIEQVSHHPPVGAAIAESAKWDYYGESAVKSKFNGRSFDINPLGTWYLNIRPKDGTEELYTWKKVTSQVVGIITGSPVVDNFGDMVIRNHTTGDVCKLKFKQRGWYGSGAYEVYGTVNDKAGTPRWCVGGRWNDKIYGRKYNNDIGDSLVTLSKESDAQAASKAKDATRAQSPTTAANAPFLVWENHARPRAPFNLTPFAITLNAIPPALRPWIAPTDTRLRPDQRAMEDGEYDFAASEKNRLEEKQRARRKQHEKAGTSHTPRWFKKAKHPVTKEDYWEFLGEYWHVRDEFGRKSIDANRKIEWPAVEDIF
ncbi:Oxysterol-binding protein-domain-containing protein [Lipomyces arxii]|uniref:Oxysterol-binding protein-domain-containing protein n=1 Tax=Lipomyces arxii TaxID=56418 RepID=UPI0034CDBFD6